MTDTNLSYQSLRVLSDRLESGELSAEQLVQHYLTQISDGTKSCTLLSRSTGRMRSMLQKPQIWHGAPVINWVLSRYPYCRQRHHRHGGTRDHRWFTHVAGATLAVDSEVGRTSAARWHDRDWQDAYCRVRHGRLGTNTGMGTPWNPWDLETHRAPGGSSSGSGVAVAADFAPCAIGTDTGGSVRLPSAWNGLSGLKTTIGNVSTEGVLPLAHTLDTPGPMCRTVADCALLFEVLRGNPATRWDSEAASLKALEKNVAGLRLGVIGQSDLDLCDSEVQEAFMLR